MNQRFASGPARLRAACAAAVLGLVLGAPASAQTNAAPTPADAVQRADARADRIAALEQELRDATAQNERLQYELMQAQREVRRLQLQIASGAPADAAPPAGGAPAPAVGGAQPPAGGALNPAQRAATGNLATQPAQTPPPAPTLSAEEAYTQARVLLTNGRHAEAEAAFRAFLEQHPSAAQAEDVRFLLPYTTLARGDHQGAAQGFLDYLQRYRNGARMPEAYARLGMALVGLQRNADACTAFRQAQRHQRASNAVRQLAQREASALSCPA